MWWEKLSNPTLHQIESNYAVQSFHVGFQVMHSEPLVTLRTLASQLLMNRNVVNLQLCRRLETFTTPVLCARVSFPLFSVLILHVALQPFNSLATHWADFRLSMHHLLVHFSLSFAAVTFPADGASPLFESFLVWTAGQLVLVEVTDLLTTVDAEAFLFLVDLPDVVLKSLRLLEHLIAIWEGACNVWFLLVSVLEMFLQSTLLDLLPTFWTRKERLSVPPHVSIKIPSLAEEHLVTQ